MSARPREPPVAIPPAHWQGGPCSVGYTYSRIGRTDHNDGSDWAVLTTTQAGVVNPGLTLPFSPEIVPITMNPTVTGAFVNGMWAGNRTVRQAGETIFIRASYQGKSGDSDE